MAVMDDEADLEQRLDHILLDAVEEEGRVIDPDEGFGGKGDAPEAVSPSTSTDGNQRPGLQDTVTEEGMCSVEHRQLIHQMFGDVKIKTRSRNAEQQEKQEARSNPPERDKEDVLVGLSKSVKELQEMVDAEAIKPRLDDGEYWNIPEAFEDCSGRLEDRESGVHGQRVGEQVLEEWLGLHHVCNLPSVRQVFHGEVSSLAVQGRFAVVGTTQGYITLAFEKQKRDEEDPLVIEKSLVGQNPALRFYPCKLPVTAVDVSIELNMIVTGHSDGSLNIWDPHRGNSVKEIKKEHDHAILYCKFITGPVCQLVTVCTTGVMHLHTIVHIPFIKKITVNSRCLLDGKRLGAIFSLDVMSRPNSQQEPQNQEETRSMRTLTDRTQHRGPSTLLSLLTCDKIIIVQISPNISIVKELPYAGGFKVCAEGPLPSCSWKPFDKTSRFPILAVVLEKRMQFVYFCEALASKEHSKSIDSLWSDSLAWAATEVQYLTNVALLVGWVSHGRCCVLDGDGRIMIYAPLIADDPSTSTLQMPLCISQNISTLKALPVYHQCFLKELGYAGKWYGGCCVSWDNGIFLGSGQGDVHLLKAFSLEEHMVILGGQGRWADALHQGARALKTRHASADVVPPSKALVQITLFIMNRFIDEQFENHGPNNMAMLQLGQVCLQVIVSVGRGADLISILFDRFKGEGKMSAFLSSLEHFVLNDRLQELPPEIVQHLIEELSSRDQPWRIEECVMHLEITSLDLNQLFGLCKKHKLYNTMIYLYQEALNDILTPLVTLFLETTHAFGETKATLQGKMYSYLACCLYGQLYPAWRGPIANVPWAKAEIIALCLYCRIAGSESRILEELIHLNSPWTIGLLYVAFDSWDSTEPELVGVLRKAHLASSVELHGNLEGQKSVCQAVSNIVAETLTDFGGEIADLDLELCKIEFLLSLRASERIVISQAAYKHMEKLLRQLIMRRIHNTGCLLEQLLVQVLRFWEPDHDTAVRIAEFANLNHLYILGAYMSSAEKKYAESLLHLLQSSDQDAVFSYLEDTLSGAKEHPNSVAVTPVSNEDKDTFMDAVFSVAEPLVNRDIYRTVKLVCAYLPDQILGMIHALSDAQLLQFRFLDTLMKEEIVLASELLRGNVQSGLNILMLYMNLLCKFQPDAVLGFLQSNEAVQIDDCLNVCREYQIKDAEAFILERMGQMMDSLLILLAFLREANCIFVSTVLKSSTAVSVCHWLPPEDKEDHMALLVQVDAYGASNDLLNVNNALDQCISFCQRNVGKVQKEEGTMLWFTLLESLIVPMQHLKHAKCKIRQDDEEEISKLSLLHFTHTTLVSRVMVHMAGYVPLQKILQGILSRYRSSEVGDFRSTLVSLLEACSYEHAILRQANRLVLDNAFEEVLELLRLKSCGLPGRIVGGNSTGTIESSRSPGPSSLQLFDELWQWNSPQNTNFSLRQPGILPPEPRFCGRIKERLAQNNAMS